MRFFDAHCDTIGKLWEGKADFITGAPTAGASAGASTGPTADTGSGAEHGDAGRVDGAEHSVTGGRLHVTLPEMRSAGMRAHVFASWVWSRSYPDRELETGLGKVEAVRRLCADYPDDLFLAFTGAEIAHACELPENGPAQTAIVASLEGADPLQGEVGNLDLFYQAGVRLITLAWGDNAFCGTTFGEGGGLTSKGVDLVAACEEKGVLVDVSHASDQAFADVCHAATKPFIASHSNCRALCPNPRNLTDEMIRAVAERGGVVCVTVVPGFLSADYYTRSLPIIHAFWREVDAGESFEEAGRRSAAAEALLPRPSLEFVADHVRHVIKVGGEDSVGLGGDLDGVDNLPAEMKGVGDYPRIAGLLSEAGLTTARVEKACFRNLARLFRDTVA
jgi:membrane dipeptidase